MSSNGTHHYHLIGVDEQKAAHISFSTGLSRTRHHGQNEEQKYGKRRRRQVFSYPQLCYTSRNSLHHCYSGSIGKKTSAATTTVKRKAVATSAKIAAKRSRRVQEESEEEDDDDMSEKENREEIESAEEVEDRDEGMAEESQEVPEAVEFNFLETQQKDE